MNKNGWGLRWELGIILVFIICLIVATIGLNNFVLFDENPAAGSSYYISSNFNYAVLE